MKASSKNIIKLSMVLTCSALFFAIIVSYLQFTPLMRWDWSAIDTAAVSFPKSFLWGSGISEYQVSGAARCPQSNWADWERKGRAPASGAACDHWLHYKQDIQLLHQLGVKAFRFTIEWSVVEPQEGSFDYAVLARYQQFCDELIAAGIQPVITLHHFVHPLWFEQKGAFEKAENIHYFVRYAQEIFRLFHNKILLWCTINEPAIYAFQAYVRGLFPPGKFLRFQQAGTLLCNLLRAHVAVYYALKKMEGGDSAQIGIIHEGLRFSNHNRWNFSTHIAARELNKLISESTLNFFLHGSFDLCMFAGIIHIHHAILKKQTFLNLLALGLRVLSKKKRGVLCKVS